MSESGGQGQRVWITVRGSVRGSGSESETGFRVTGSGVRVRVRVSCQEVRVRSLNEERCSDLDLALVQLGLTEPGQGRPETHTVLDPEPV